MNFQANMIPGICALAVGALLTFFGGRLCHREKDVPQVKLLGVALAVVGALKGQLKQAAQQSAASGYIREGSFRLDVNADHFLYESTTKRKIENNTQKK